MMRSVLCLLPLVLVAGCGDGGPQIDPAKVVSLEQLTGRESMVVTNFFYKDADVRGWPASVEHRQYVRFLQDRGVLVVFSYSEETGLHYMMIGMTDFPRVMTLREEAKKQGVPVPTMDPEDEEAGTQESQR